MSQPKTLEKIRSQIDCEDDLQSYMELGMEQNNWTVLREVSARHNNYRADIVAKRDDIGTVGIECKYVTGGPIVAAEAARQIFEKYSGEKFFQWDIDAWGVCLFGRTYVPDIMKRSIDDYEDETYYYEAKGRDRGEVAATQRILNGLGLGFATPHQDRVVMEFLPPDRAVRIPLFQVDGSMPDKYANYVDMDRIVELIDERRP